MVVINIDSQPVLADLREMKSAWREDVALNFAEAGRKIVDLFRHTWLSGRSGDRGLNIVSGTLFQSVRSLTTVKADSIESLISNQGADYWFYHEHPENGRTQFLHLEDAFVADGGPLYEDAIEQALKAVA